MTRHIHGINLLALGFILGWFGALACVVLFSRVPIHSAATANIESTRAAMESATRIPGFCMGQERLPSGGLMLTARDAWGRSLWLEGDRGHLRIVSSGPDGAIGSLDDDHLDIRHCYVETYEVYGRTNDL